MSRMCVSCVPVTLRNMCKRNGLKTEGQSNVHMDLRELRLFGFAKTGVIFSPFPSSSVNQEYPTLTTFFAGEIISRKRPFLTRKWDADEDVDRKHWVSMDVWPL